ncbi:hypothetical protein LWI29_007657 [Acer saccharum]|uniref:SMC hinge domain-containing protein n=1 Tax=Acer saccharum TaxID=4024 RepID=A0AA39VR64_ACESA|nr:hypothetical protein LWI29_007657 [Acer saccharum]
MLEEAAGTRMYETKKEAALKTLEKKQSKVDEINKLLDQEILPALEKLRKERTQYMQWANGSAELDRLRRFCIAYEYVQAEKIRDSAVGDVEQVKAKIAEIDKNTERTRLEILEMEKLVSNLTAEKEASMGGEVKILSDKVDKLSQGLVFEGSVLNNKDDNLRSEKENAKKIVRNIEDLKQSIEEKASAVRRSEEGAVDLKKRVEELSKNLEEYEKDYQDRASEMELVQKLKDEIRNLSAQLANVQFSYRDPVKSFDRSKVKGVVAKLIKVKNNSTMIALEVTAGGKLYNVIVDTENTGKQLLQHGDL